MKYVLEGTHHRVGSKRRLVLDPTPFDAERAAFFVYWDNCDDQEPYREYLGEFPAREFLAFATWLRRCMQQVEGADSDAGEDRPGA